MLLVCLSCVPPVMGKAEGLGENWHGHVTAVTVAPEFRRLHMAKKLMGFLEAVSEHVHNGYFVDLFVRVGNSVAIGMYQQLGYIVYRTVTGYYSGTEDAYGERARTGFADLLTPFCVVPPLLNDLRLVGCWLCRHAKGASAGCRSQVHHTPYQTCHAL